MPYAFRINFQPRSLFFLVLIAAAITSFAQTSAKNSRQPVVVELFTSEGCSDCPPADALLARLDATQFVPGAYAIVLSEHVTYWDHLGWRDPFSLDSVTERQQTYGHTLGLSEIYTPQMIVDGAQQFVGSDDSALKRAVVRAAALPKADLVIENLHWSNGVVQFAIRTQPGIVGSLVAVLAIDATHSDVIRGENAGRTLHHVAVARVLKDFGENAADGRQLQLPLAAASTGKADPLRLIVFLMAHNKERVIAVAEQTISHPD